MLTVYGVKEDAPSLPLAGLSLMLLTFPWPFNCLNFAYEVSVIPGWLSLFCF